MPTAVRVFAKRAPEQQGRPFSRCRVIVDTQNQFHAKGPRLIRLISTQFYCRKKDAAGPESMSSVDGPVSLEKRLRGVLWA